MLNLSGLSATYPGYMAQEDQTAKTQQNQAAAQEAAFKLLGAHVLGRALTGAQPGTPQGGPQPPAPGQPSAPAASQPMAQGAPPVAPQPAPGPAGAPPSAGGSGLPEVSLQALTQRILQTSPQVAQHPEVLLAALERAAPILDRQSKEDLAELRKQMTTERLNSAAAIAKARQDSLDNWRGAQGARADRRADQADDRLESLDAYRRRTGDQRDAEEIGRNGRFAATEEGRNTRAAAQGARTDRRLDQTDTREARLAANSGVRNDAMMQRLELQKQDLQRKVEQGGDKQALAQWRAVVDAQHKRATEIIQSNAFGSNLSKDDRRALLDEQRAAYETEIAGMRGKMTASPAAPAAPAPAAAAPKGPVKVNTPEEAAALAPGTPYVTPDGKAYTR